MLHLLLSMLAINAGELNGRVRGYMFEKESKLPAAA